MSVSRILDRAALVVLSGLALCAAALSQGALAGSTPAFRNIRVDVQPLRANAGDPTATWVEQDLSGQLAQALSGRMARDGAPLIVRTYSRAVNRRNAARQRIFGQYPGRCGDQRARDPDTSLEQLLYEPDRSDDDRALKSRPGGATYASAGVLDWSRRVLLRARPRFLGSDVFQSRAQHAARRGADARRIE